MACSVLAGHPVGRADLAERPPLAVGEAEAQLDDAGSRRQPIDAGAGPSPQRADAAVGQDFCPAGTTPARYADGRLSASISRAVRRLVRSCTLAKLTSSTASMRLIRSVTVL
jgi:hypothetical protein